MRFEQKGDVFDIPITVTIGYRDGTTEDVMVALHDRIVERTIPLKGEVRSLEVNQDGGALAGSEEVAFWGRRYAPEPQNPRTPEPPNPQNPSEPPEP